MSGASRCHSSWLRGTLRSSPLQSRRASHAAYVQVGPFSTTLTRLSATEETAKSTPKLNPSSLAHIAPLGTSKPSSERAAQLSRLLNVLDESNGPSDPAEVRLAYLALDQTEGDTHFLSPEETGKILSKLSARTAVQFPGGLQLLNSVISNASESRREAVTRVEAREWDKVLSPRRIQRMLVNQVIRSTRRFEAGHVSQALDSLSELLDGSNATKQSIKDWNLLLHILVQSGFHRHQANANFKPVPAHAHLPPNQRPRKVPVKKGPAASALAHASQELREAANSAEHWSLGRVYNSFRYIWTAIVSSGTPLQPDASTYSIRMAIEARMIEQEIYRVLDNEVLRDRTLRFTWQDLRKTLIEIDRAGLLNMRHIDQAVTAYGRLRTVISKAVRAGKVSMEGSAKIEARVFGDVAPGASVDHVREVYEVLRFNVLRRETEALRRQGEAEAQEMQAAKGIHGQEKHGFFHRLFGTPDARHRPEISSTEAGEHKTSAPAVLPLVGIELGASMIPSAVTFEQLSRYYAAVCGDYQAAIGIVEDYRSSQEAEDGALPSSSVVGVGTLDGMFLGFALHGVPFQLESDQWVPRQGVTGHRDFDWNILNLWPFVDELLALRPGIPSATKREAEQRRYRRVAETVSENAEAASQEGSPFEQPTRGATFARSHDESAVNLVQRSPTNRAPSRKQVFTLLTALRRCMGDEHDDHVLDVFHRLEAKFGYGPGWGFTVAPEGEIGSGDHALLREQSALPNRQGWRGWMIDARLRRLVSFLRQRVAERR
ncbi:unnamed protein product [Jaminaea pallidilutea]